MKKLWHKSILTLSLFSSGIFLGPAIALGADFTPGGPAFKSPIGPTSFAALISAIMNVVVKVGAVIVVFAIIYAGFLFVTAQGNDDKIQKAKSTFFWVVIGAIVLLGAQALGDVICNTAGEFGASCK